MRLVLSNLNQLKRNSWKEIIENESWNRKYICVKSKCRGPNHFEVIIRHRSSVCDVCSIKLPIKSSSTYSSLRRLLQVDFGLFKWLKLSSFNSNLVITVLWQVCLSLFLELALVRSDLQLPTAHYYKLQPKKIPK